MRDTKCNETNYVSPVALFDNAAPLKSRRPVPISRETHSQTVGGLGARLSHIGQQNRGEYLSGAKPQRYTRMRRDSSHAVAQGIRQQHLYKLNTLLLIN